MLFHNLPSNLPAHVPPSLSFAVPSWLVPGTAAENARLLKTLHWPDGFRLAELGLCCFETESSLHCPQTDYPNPDDLPLNLTGNSPQSLACHVHLPTDLPWELGKAAELSLRLFQRLRQHLPAMHRAVLHPPALTDPRPQLELFVTEWVAQGLNPAHIMLENDRNCSVEFFLQVLDALPVSVCLDVAHVLAYGQEALLPRLDPARVMLLHWSAPGPVPGKDRHLPLTQFTAEQAHTARAAAACFAQALPLVEVFSLAGVQESLPVLLQLYAA